MPRWRRSPCSLHALNQTNTKTRNLGVSKLMRKADVAEAFWLVVAVDIVLRLPAAAAYIAGMRSAVADRRSCRPRMGVLHRASPPVVLGPGNGSRLRESQSQIHHQLHSRCQMRALAHSDKPFIPFSKTVAGRDECGLPVSDSCLQLW